MSTRESGPNGQGLPKAIVDEIEAFTSATIGTRANFFVEQYVVDGGEPGLLRDAWISDRLNPWNARIPLYLQGGQFTLPLPVDPETFRDTYQEYTPYVQTVGANPFNFFDPAMGMRLGVGDPLRGVSLQLFGGPGYTRQSGLAPTGVDTQVYAQDAMGPFTLSIFRYDGLRPIAGEPFDRFERTGFGLTYGQWTRFSSETVLINGWDSNCATPRLVGCTLERRVRAIALCVQPPALRRGALRGDERPDRWLHARRGGTHWVWPNRKHSRHGRGRDRARAADHQYHERAIQHCVLSFMRPAIATLLLIATLAAGAPAARAIDPARSTAQFSVQHIWVESVKGSVPILSGSVLLGPGSVIPTSVSAVLDATRIATDEPDRDRSLESADFFDAKKFPSWTFFSTKIVSRGPNAFEMDGNLTIHGVTQPEQLNVTVSGNLAHPRYHAEAQIDRHAFGMTRTRLDPTIGNTADITLDVTLK